MKQQQILVAVALATVIVLTGCDGMAYVKATDENPLDGNILYSTSFETEAAFSDWRGYGIAPNKEAPEPGGRRSAHVSGGCDHPHATYKLGAVAKDGYLVLRAWGKDLGIGGGIMLKNMDTGAYIRIHVQDSSWTHYLSSDSLFVHAGQELRLTMSSGGFVASAMLVDVLKVARVDT